MFELSKSRWGVDQSNGICRRGGRVTGRDSPKSVTRSKFGEGQIEGEARIEGAKRPSIDGEARIEGAKRPRIEGKARAEGAARDISGGRVWGGGSVNPSPENF